MQSLATLARKSLHLPAPWRVALKLALLAASLPLVYHGMRHSNPLTGGGGVLSFAVLWIYHGMTSGFAPVSDATVHSTSPTSGEAIIPGTHGLTSSGKYTGSSE